MRATPSPVVAKRSVIEEPPGYPIAAREQPWAGDHLFKYLLPPPYYRTGYVFALLQPRRLGDDSTCHLMPQDQGRPDGIDGSADDLQISAAQAHRADADHHVVRGYLWRFGNLSDL